jgi:hypothetical protein
VRIVKTFLVTVAVIATGIALLWAFVVPRVLDHSIRARLANAGFHDASFKVGDVGFDHVDVLDLKLAKGLELGDVEIESGPYALWRGRHPDVTLHGPRISTDTPMGKSPSGKLPFGRVRVDGGELRAGRSRIAVRGSIDLRGRDPQLALDLRALRIDVGPRAIEDVVATVRGPSSDLRVCGTASLGRSAGDMAGVVDPRVDTTRLADAHLDANRLADPRLDTTRLAGARLDTCFRLNGSHIEDGAVRATVPREAAGGVTFDDATLAARFSGDLSTRTFNLQGELRAGSVATPKGTLDGIRLPFDVTASVDHGLHVRSKRALVVDIASATLAIGSPLKISAPKITARGTARVDGVELTAGAPADALQLVASLRGVPIDRLLASTTKNHVRGTGVLDGDLVFELAGDELAVVGGKLSARRPGRLRVDKLAAKEAEIGYALHRRLTGALADFAYTRFDIALARDPEIRLALSGRGRAIPQDVAIDVNVRGLFARNERKR